MRSRRIIRSALVVPILKGPCHFQGFIASSLVPPCMAFSKGNFDQGPGADFFQSTLHVLCTRLYYAPIRGQQHDDGDCSKCQVLLVTEVLVRGQQDFLPAQFGGTQKVPVFEYRPTFLIYGIHAVAFQVSSERSRRSLVKQDFHSILTPLRDLASCSRTAFTCHFSTPSNHSRNSSIVAPLCRFSKRANRGTLVPVNTHAPLTNPGRLSTAGQVSQAIIVQLSSKLPIRECRSINFFPSLPKDILLPSVWLVPPNYPQAPGIHIWILLIEFYSTSCPDLFFNSLPASYNLVVTPRRLFVTQPAFDGSQHFLMPRVSLAVHPCSVQSRAMAGYSPLYSAASGLGLRPPPLRP